MCKTPVLAVLAAFGLGASAKVLPETVVVAQTQFYPWREQARGYLGRYLNQPLLVDPDLPVDPDREDIDPIKGWGSFPSQADYDLTIRLATDYGFDGVAFFGSRPPRFLRAAEKCPVRDFVAVPILTWGDTGRKFEEKVIKVAGRALACSRNYIHDGKILVPAYWTDKDCTPEAFREKYAALRDRFGDRFIIPVALTRLSSGRMVCDANGKLPPAKRRELEDWVRAWARVSDGVQICELNVTSKGERSERVSFVEYLRTEYDIVRNVLDEPEFGGRKLLVGAAVNGHMNAYMKGYNTLENCTKTLRDTFGLALEYDCDLIQLPEWDEYNENTCFMPTLYGSWALKRISRYYCSRAKRRPLEPIVGDDRSLPNLIVSYRKCLSPGERLTVEILNVPDGSRSGTVVVRADVLDEADRPVKALAAKTLDETQLDEVRYELDSAEIARVARAPRVRVFWTKDGVEHEVLDGLHPIDLAPANTWNHLAVKHPLRDLVRLTKADVSMRGRRVTAAVLADEPIRYAMLCGNGCIQYVQGKPGSKEERFRESSDWAVFQVSPVCVGRHRPKKTPYSYRVSGIAEAEWLYVGEVTSGERLELRDINGHATPPIYLRVPKAKLKGAVLDVDYAELGFSGRVPLDAAFSKTSYSVGESIKSMQVTVTRFALQPRYPSVANAREVSFAVDADADRQSMMYHVQVVTMSGKVWYSRPFVVEAKGGTVPVRLWNAMKERAETLHLPSARVPTVAFDFSPDAGNVLRNAAGERHWFGLLGGPYSSANLWNRGARTEGAVDKRCAQFFDLADSSVPKCVQETDGTWSLAFDGVDDFANIPCEMWPTFGGCAVELDVWPDAEMSRRGSLFASLYGLLDLGVEPDGCLSVAFWGFGSHEARKPVRGGRLVKGAWNRLKLVNDVERLTLFVNGRQVAELPIRMPSENTMGMMIGGYPVYDLGFFKGRIRNMSVTHRSK